MADSARDNPLKLRLRAARLQPVPAGGSIAAARFVQPDVDGHEACLGPIAFQTLNALAAIARHTWLPLNTDDQSTRRIPQYRVNRPVQPIFLTFVSPGLEDLVLFLWQPASFLSALRVVFFPGSPAGQGGYHWPTHEIVLHLPSGGSETETRVAPEDFDLDARLQVQLLNAAARLGSESQWVEIEESEFRDRAAGQGVPLPPFHLEMLMAALAEILVPGGYIALTGWSEPAKLGASGARLSYADGAKRGPISQEKIVPEHWVLGPRKSGGENCAGICAPEYSDPRHGVCLDCGRKTWHRRGSIHLPGGASVGT